MSAQVLQHQHIGREALKTELLFVDDPRIMEFLEGFQNRSVEGLVIFVPLNVDGSVNQDIQRMVTAWGPHMRSTTFEQALDLVLGWFTDTTYFRIATFTP